MNSCTDRVSLSSEYLLSTETVLDSISSNIIYLKPELNRKILVQEKTNRWIITKRLNDVIVAVVEEDIEVLHYIKKVTKSNRVFYAREQWISNKGHTHKKAWFLTLASKNMVERLMEIGMMPRKTYRDDPLPDMTEDMLPHFIRGYFDGDGCAFIDLSGRRRLRFIGTPKIMTEIQGVLHLTAGMSPAKVTIESREEVTWARLSWTATEDIKKFHKYIYDRKFDFCYDRKRKALEERILKKLYHTLRPKEVGQRVGRSAGSVYWKAKEEGLR